MAAKSSYEPVATSKEDSNEAGRSQRRSWMHSTDDNWLAEIACIVIGVILIIALCVLLWSYDGEPAPHLGPAFVTLNTIVAVLSVCASAALIFPVAECISQLKWIYFEKDYRRLTDMDAFDKASRGWWGGLGLLWKTRFRWDTQDQNLAVSIALTQNRNLSSIGAFLMLLNLAIQPLSQQLVAYVDIRVPSNSGNATIGILNGWSEDLADAGNIVVPNAGGEPSQYSAITIGMTNSIQAALFHGDAPISAIAPSCPGGNCTFEPYLSLGVCSSFADVTSHLIEKKHRTNDTEARMYVTAEQYIRKFDSFKVISAATREKQAGAGDLSTSLAFDDSIAFQGHETPIADFYVMFANGRNYTQYPYYEYSFGATECLLEWCVQNLTTDVVSGTAVTQTHKLIREFTGAIPRSRPVGDEGTRYEVDESTHNTLQRYFRSVLHGSVTAGNENSLSTTNDPALALFQPFNVWTGDHANRDWPDGVRGTNETGLERIINNVATGMTN
ncbi:hypothetical protein LTR37_000418 [Vermiconidia calcicola]|uniref:Uncharacterized protein n=1 Tax=Vermiconidia calcicola TaxID=1690605 RepID=A0ACC3NYY7_9PEZI|nr:hypothetical protein LTR37_000418 [Vermiconidia calcicola]